MSLNELDQLIKQNIEKYQVQKMILVTTETMITLNQDKIIQTFLRFISWT